MAGIGAFGSAMIPLGQAAGTFGSQYNQLQQQALKNQLEQQQMLLNQGRLQLETQQQRMQDAELRFNMGHELYNQKQQQAQQAGAAGMFAKMGAMTSDPKERMFWDAAGNAAMNNVPPEQIDKMANTMGYGDQSKALREYYQAMWYNAKAGSEDAYTQLINRLNPGGGGSAGAGSPGSMTPISGYGAPPGAASGYGAGAGSGGYPAGYGAGAVAGYGAGRGAGGAPSGMGTPVGTTSRYRNTIIPKGGQYYFVDGSGNVYGPIPMATGVAGGSSGAP